MRWKPDPHSHDRRLIDLLAVFTLLLLIVAVDHYMSDHPKPNLANFIVPSQNVRW